MKQLFLLANLLLVCIATNAQTSKYDIQNKMVMTKVAKQLEIRNANYDAISNTISISISLNSVDSVGVPGHRFAISNSIWTDKSVVPPSEIGQVSMTTILNWALNKYGLTLKN